MRNKTILIVDDDADVREGLRSLLQSVGLRSETFGSTTVLLKSKLADEVSCLILDVRLPGLSGLDFQAEVTGAVEFLTKPIREQDLLDAVRVALERDRVRRQHDNDMQELRANYHSLSHREREVMRLVVAGLMNKQAAAEIGISEVTLKVHRHNIMKKLCARSLADLVRMADGLGIPRWKSKH